MRIAGLVVLSLAAASPARADRSTVWSLGATLDERALGTSFSDAGTEPARALGGARLTLAFEDAPLAMPPPGLYEAGVRFVPELLAGFLADDTRAEGYVGAGLRAEIDLASNRHLANMHTGIYLAARGIAIGKQQDGAAEFAMGEYLSHGPDLRRFGWEGSVLVRPHPSGQADGTRELDALMSLYVSWR
jgi:hypothetical protein